MYILEDLFCGRISPHEKPVEPNGAYARATAKMDLAERKLLAASPEERKQAYENYEDCRAEYVYQAEVGAFVEGFRLGVRLFVAAFDAQMGFGR